MSSTEKAAAVATIKQYIRSIFGRNAASSAGDIVCEQCPVLQQPAGIPGNASLEAYGIHVAKLAGLCGLQHQQNTVTARFCLEGRPDDARKHRDIMS